MKNKQNKPVPTSLKAGSIQLAALASPLRMELLGLFTNLLPLSIADMAMLMGRAAGSLYHHVGILEKAGLLARAGTRPKGKRYEALFLPSASRIEIDSKTSGNDGVTQIVKTMSSAFRMAEKDLEAALQNNQCPTTGPDRNLLATRIHLRISPKKLQRLNKHLQAIEHLIGTEASTNSKPLPGDQHLSLTIALLPLKGRGHQHNPKGD